MRLTEDISKLSQFPCYESLVTNEREAFLRYYARYHIKSGSNIEYALNGKRNMCFLEDGNVELFYIDFYTGRQLTVLFLSAGSLFGDLSSWADTSEHQYITKARAVTEATIGVIDCNHFIEILQQNKAALLSFLDLLGKHVIYRLVHKTIELSEMDIECRLLSELIKYNFDNRNQLGSKCKFTHEQLASMVGAARPTVTKALLSLVKKGLITIQGNRDIQICAIRDPEKYILPEEIDEEIDEG